MVNAPDRAETSVTPSYSIPTRKGNKKIAASSIEDVKQAAENYIMKNFIICLIP
jgi:hypothetical protein